jgi:tetratricopeptide (TPR) repeat protein
MTMQGAWATAVRRSLGLVLLGAAGLAAPAAAQFARVSTSRDAVKVLVVPFTRPDRDSAMSVMLANALRERLKIAYSDRFNVIEKRVIDTNIVISGFSVDMPLDPTNARQLGRVLNARLLVEGVILQAGDDSVQVVGRMAEVVGQRPQSATASVTLERRNVNARTANEIGNRLADYFRSFEPAKSCNLFREAQDYVKALDAARTALTRYPASSQALLCMAQVMRAQNAPADTVVRLLERAQSSDSMNVIAQWQLAGFAEERRDTLALIHAMHHILIADFGNNAVRIDLARLFFTKGMPDSALMVLDTALNRNPNQADLLDMRSRVYSASERYPLAAADLARVAELDTAKVDSAFVFRIVNVYQRAADTTNLLAWLRRGTERVPSQTSYLYQLQSILWAKADSAGAVTAIRSYVRLLPNEGRGHLVLASYLTALGQGDSALAHALAAGQADSTLRPSASGIIFRAGAVKLQAQDYPGAVELLQRAKEWATGPAVARLAPQIAYYLGLGQLQMAVAADNEAQTASTPAQAPARCDAVRRVAALLAQAEENITAGGRTNPEQANQILTQAIPAYRQRAQVFNRQARCPAQ